LPHFLNLFLFNQLRIALICKSFVLILMQQCRGWVGASLLRPSRRTLTHLISDPESSTLVPRIGRSPVRSKTPTLSEGFFSILSAVNCGPSVPCPEPPRFNSSCLPSFPASTAGASGDSCSSVSALNFQPSTLDLHKSFTCNTCEPLATVDSKRLT
jgi:hypothetical protein